MAPGAAASCEEGLVDGTEVRLFGSSWFRLFLLSIFLRLKLKRETLEKLNMINGPGDLEEFTAELCVFCLFLDLIQRADGRV